jgi:hypothetical protein
MTKASEEALKCFMVDFGDAISMIVRLLLVAFFGSLSKRYLIRIHKETTKQNGK